MNATGLATAPLLPPWLLLLMAVAALALAAFALWRRAPGVAWRVAAMALVLAVLLGPRLMSEERHALDDVALVVVDETDSQSLDGRDERTAAWLAEVRARLEAMEGLEVRLQRVGPAPPGREGTRLHEAVARGLSDVPRDRRAGVVALTDGQVHDSPPGDPATEIGAPFHVLLTGRRDEGDRRLVVERAPGYGLVGESVTVRLRVDDPPEAASGPIRLTVRDGGGWERHVTVRAGQPRRLMLDIEHAGRNLFEIEAEPGPRELTLENNRAVITVTGVRDRLRVLLISGEPHMGGRTWRNLLKADPGVDLVHFTILRPPEKDDMTPLRELALIAFPVRELFEERLHDFDLVIFDRYTNRGILPEGYLNNVVDYVRGGGALLMAVGPEYNDRMSLYVTPLAHVLPAAPREWTHERAFMPALSDTGLRHPVTSVLTDPAAGNGSPDWGRWLRQVGASRVAGETLMTGVDGDPLLVVDRQGEGRVALLLSDTVWLWARGFEGGGPQAELLRRLAHWLMKEPELEEESLRLEAEDRRLSVIRRSLEDEPGPVSVTTPSGEESSLSLEADGPGLWRADMRAEETGLYRARTDDGLAAVALAGRLDTLEMDKVTATSDLLAPVSEATGGGVFWPVENGLPEIRRTAPGRAAASSPDQRGPGWLGLIENQSYEVTGLTAKPMAHGALLLLALVALLLAWRREGR